MPAQSKASQLENKIKHKKHLTQKKVRGPSGRVPLGARCCAPGVTHSVSLLHCLYRNCCYNINSSQGLGGC